MIVSVLALQLTIPLGLDTLLPTPENNRLDPAKAALGKKLFWDVRLSGDKSTSCATCHDPKHAFTDAQPVAKGIHGQKGTRRTPAILNRAYGKSFSGTGEPRH
jgi:cytochrome c peroxidase